MRTVGESYVKGVGFGDEPWFVHQPIRAKVYLREHDVQKRHSSWVPNYEATENGTPIVDSEHTAIGASTHTQNTSVLGAEL